MGNNIVLIGFMGAGKTTVGRRLAAVLNRPFIDVDQMIEADASRSIGDIFRADGEAAFRAMEADAVRRASGAKNAIIAVGGGAIVNRDNMEALRRSGTLVWLRVPLEDMTARAALEGGRPLLQDAEAAAALYEERLPLYSLADIIVDADGLGPDETAKAVKERLEGGPDDEQRETVHVDLGERSYDVHVGAGVLDRAGQLCEAAGLSKRGLLITNPTVGRLYGSALLRTLARSGLRVPKVDIPDGEQYKCSATLHTIYEAALSHRLERSGAFFALGGGVVGDVAGFAAASYLRGVDFVQVPTTLLAQVDSSVGGKTGINLDEGKNLVGAFHQPRLVLADVSTLQTLPERQLQAGFAEVIKYGAIADGPLFDFLAARRLRLAEQHTGAITKVVARSCAIKADIVKQDERETAGVRELLNFGHTVGHALEVLGGYTRWLHGEAVAIGMVTAAFLSVRAGTLSEADAGRLINLIGDFGLPVSPGEVDTEQLLAALRLDKKVRRNRPRFVLLRGIGAAYVTDEVEDEWVKEAIEKQQQL